MDEKKLGGARIPVPYACLRVRKDSRPVLIFAAILSIFVYGMLAAMLGTILPDLSERFGLTPSQNGTIALAQGVGLTIASIGVGPLLDLRGDKAGLVLGLSLIVIGLALLPRSTGFRSIVSLLFVLGVGGSIIVTGANALVSGGVSDAHRATALNLLNLFFGLGGLTTPLISANLFRKSPSRLCYAIGVLSAAALVVSLVTAMPAPTGAGGFVLSSAGPILGKPLIFLLGLFLFLYVACEVGVWNWLPRHLIAQGIPESRALNILSLGFALGLLLGRVAVAPVLIHAQAIEVTLAASIAMAVTTFLMLRTNNPTAAWVLVFLAGVSMAPVFPTVLAITGTAFPQLPGTAIGFVITFGWAGLVASSPIIGGVAGSDPTRLRKALLIIPVSSVLMVAVNLAVWSAMK
jgi:fucose permease